MKILKMLVVLLLMNIDADSHALRPQHVATFADFPIQLAWSPLGDELYTTVGDSLLAIDRYTAEVRQLYQGEQLARFAVAPDGRIAFFDGIADDSIAYDANLIVLPAELGASLLVSVKVPQALNVNRLSWSPDSTRIATTTAYGQVYDATSGEQILQLPAVTDGPRTVGMFDVDWLNNDQVVLLTLSRAAHIYDVGQQAFVAQAQLTVGDSALLPLAQDRTQMVGHSLDQLLLVDTASWEVVTTLPLPNVIRSVYPLTVRWLNSDSGVILTPIDAADVAVCVFETLVCTMVGRLPHNINTTAPALHPDGTLLAYAVGRDIYLLDLSDALAELGLDVAY